MSHDKYHVHLAVTRASFTAVAIIVLSMVLAANHATLVPVFAQVIILVVVLSVIVMKFVTG